MLEKRLAVLVLCAAMCAAAPAPGAAAEWQKLWATRLKGSSAGAATPVATADGAELVALAFDAGWLGTFDAGGKPVWLRRVGDRLQQSPSVGDVDGDGASEIAMVDQSGRVYCFDAGGKLRWQFWLEGKTPDWLFLVRRLGGWAYASSPRVADLDGDGRAELVAGDRRGWVTCLDGRGNLRWRVRVPDEVSATPWVGDADGDGAADVVFPCADRRLYCLGATGELKWHAPTQGDASRSNPVAADLEGNGEQTLIVGTESGELVAVRGSDGKVAWVARGEGTIRSALATADLDGDGRQEVLFGTEGDRSYGNAELYCLDAQGRQRWRLRFEFQGGRFLGLDYPFYVIQRANEEPELVIAPDGSASVFVVSAGGAIKQRIPCGVSYGGCSVLRRLGGDRRVKVLVTDGDVLTCLDSGLDGDAVRILWPRDARAAAGAHRARRAAAAPRRPGVRRTRIAVGRPVHIEGSWYRLRVSTPRLQQPATLTAIVSAPQGSCYGVIVSADPGKGASADARFEALGDGRYAVRAWVTGADRRRLGQVTAAMRLSPVAGTSRSVRDQLLHLAACQAQFSRRNMGAARYLATARRDLQARAKGTVPAVRPSERAARWHMARLLGLAREASRLSAWADALARRQVAAGGPVAFVAWPANPWAAFDPALPPAGSAAEIAITCYQGEYRSLALNIGNFCDRSLAVRATTAGEASAAAMASGGLSLTLREAVPVRTLRGTTVWDALMPIGRLGRENQAVTVPPWQARQLWVTIEAPRGQPGERRAEISLNALRERWSQRIALRVRVLPIARPAKSPLAFINWADLWRWPLDSPVYRSAVNDLVSHGTNVFYATASPIARFDANGELTGPLDFSQHDAQLKPLLGKGQILFIGHWGYLSGPEPPLSPPWNRAFREYLPRWVAHLRELGMGYDDFALYPFDEAWGPTFDQLLAHARLAKEIDPRVRIYCDLGGVLPTPDQLRAARDLIDIYQPWQGHFEDEVPPWLTALKATGKTVWMYRETNNMKELSPLGYYRRMPWLAWKRGLTGFGIYTYLYKDPWRVPEWDISEFGIVYPTPAEIVPSKRWEAVREGIQDYEALWLLREALIAARARGRDVSAEQRVLDEAPREVLASGVDSAVLSRWRQRIAEAMQAVSSSTPGSTGARGFLADARNDTSGRITAPPR